MSANSGGASPPDRVESSGNAPANSPPGQGRRGRNKNHNRGNRNTSTFSGAIEDLKDAVYDVVAGKETFTETTRKIAIYVTREFSDAGDYRVAMEELQLEELVPPEEPADDASRAAFEIWKTKLHNYNERVNARKRVSGRIYATVIGQCSQALRNRMEAHEEWSEIHAEGDVIRLLRLIRTCMSIGQTRQYDYLSWVNSENQLLQCRQTKYMSNNEYYEKFKECVANFERLGTRVGYDESRVQDILDEIAGDAAQPTDEELFTARETVKQRYLAVRFLKNSHEDRYEELLRNLQNDFSLRKEGKYPETLTAAYDCLVNFKPAPGDRGRGEAGGLAFYNEGGGGGRSGGQGRGRGGRGTSGGRGRGRGAGGRGGDGRSGDGDKTGKEKVETDNETVNEDAQYLLDQVDNNNDEFAAYTIDYAVDRAESSHQMLAHNGMQDDSLLLDSCSTVCLISNRNLLHNLHTVDHWMRVRCNAGVRSTNQMGYLGTFPEPVWFDPNGIANILSLFVVQKYYRVSYDSAKEDAFRVALQNRTLVFRPTGKGLYALDRSGDTVFATTRDDWAMVNTVQEKMSQYSKRAYQGAVRARRVQNIMMHPSDRQFREIIDHNLIKNLDITRPDVEAANDIFGPNLGSLYGKTVCKKGPVVKNGIDGVPPEIKEKHQSVVLAIDILFINKVPFLVTTSRGLHFGTAEDIPDRQIPTVAKALNRVIRLYRQRGFRVTTVNGDGEFAPLQADMPKISFNLSSRDEHVPEIERYIRTLKDRVRSCYNTLPFSRIPRLMLVRLVGNAVFWLNAFPHKDGVSSTLSPRYLLTGQHLDASKHIRCEFGSYAQTHEPHTSDMQARTTGAICLGPSGNEQGGHYFMSLSTGKRLHRRSWTSLPMPNDAIERVDAMGKKQKMPKTLTFANRFGLEYPDHPGDVDDDHDSSYAPSDEDSVTTSSSSSSYDTEDLNDDDDFPHHETPINIAGVDHVEPDDNNNNDESDDESDDNNDESDDESDDNVDPNGDVGDNDAGSDSESHTDDSGTDDDGDGEPQITGVVAPPETTGVGEDNDDDSTTEGDEHESQHDPVADEMDARYGPRNHNINLRPRKLRTYDHLHAYLADVDPAEMKENQESLEGSLFMTEQMSLKRGLKAFGNDGAEAVVKELRQLVRMGTIVPRSKDSLSREQLKRALRYLMYLKQKRCGRIKARGCADGRPQRLYKSKEETSSPTVATESIFLTSVIDAYEGREVVTVDIPGAFMHSDMDELIHMKLEGPMAELLGRVNPDEYKKHIVIENGRPVIYVELAKALYGTLQAALLFWKNISAFLVDEMGFKINPYDSCVANKTINGKQCTVCWHVDDLKISHVEQSVLDEVVSRLDKKYGSTEAPVTATRGKVHDYLGMTLDFSEHGKVKFRMDDYVENLLNEAPSDFDGISVTPATANLFTINDDAEKLSPDKTDTFHRFTAKLLYLCKRVRVDIQTAVAFLTTRVKQPDVDDWKKLARCIRYLRGEPKLALTLEMADCCKMQWWIDASFAVHRDMRSHTGVTMSLGKGSAISSSTRQKINTKSSTEAELVGVDDGMYLITWTRNFLIAQGVAVKDNVVYQDNQSAILLERNGRSSSGRRSRHIDIRYFFVTDRIQRKELRVEYCPTEEMLADFFTKPLQGTLFRKMRQRVMNLIDPNDPERGQKKKEMMTSDEMHTVRCLGDSQECVGDAVGWTVVRRRGMDRRKTSRVEFTPTVNRTSTSTGTRRRSPTLQQQRQVVSK